MKTFEFDLDYKLIKAAPAGSAVDVTFTKRVMREILSPSLDNLIDSTSQPIKRSLLYRFRHLPKFAVIMLAVAFLFTISGVTYAVVETIKHANVQIEKSGMDSSGREQLSVTFDSCAQERKTDRTYELKKDSGLSAEDGADVLQAQCDLDYIENWIRNDTTFTVQDKEGLSLTVDGLTGALASTSSSELTLHYTSNFARIKSDRTKPFPQDARVIEGGKVVDRNSLKPGDTILYFSPGSGGFVREGDPVRPVVVFKLNLDPKFYSLDMRSYVSAKGPCISNPERICLLQNSINTVTLMVTRGGASYDETRPVVMKNIQGRVVSWDGSSFKLDVGKGVIYTIHTPSNVINTYNTSTVYGLKSFDTIYAKTDAEDLKIRAGDSLDIYYLEAEGQSSQAIDWSDVSGVSLMVERTIQDLEKLRKY